MKYAHVIGFDEENRRWRVIGVMAANSTGEARVKLAHNDPLVLRVPGYAMAEQVNHELDEGEVTFYRRDPDEMASHVEHIRTDDPEFIEKYGWELEGQRKWIRLGTVMECLGDDVEAVLDELLREVRQMPLAGV